MYNSTHVPPITIVAMPISGSLLGIFFVVLGSVMLYNFRRNVAIETADFDFNTTEKQLEYKTFWERLRDSMMNAFGSQNNDVYLMYLPSLQGVCNILRLVAFTMGAYHDVSTQV